AVEQPEGRVRSRLRLHPAARLCARGSSVSRVFAEPSGRPAGAGRDLLARRESLSAQAVRRCGADFPRCLQQIPEERESAGGLVASWTVARCNRPAGSGLRFAWRRVEKISKSVAAGEEPSHVGTKACALLAHDPEKWIPGFR